GAKWSPGSTPRPSRRRSDRLAPTLTPPRPPCSTSKPRSSAPGRTWGTRAPRWPRARLTARAQVTVADTNRDLGRKGELFQRALIPKSDYDTAQAAYDAAVTML